MRTVLLAALSAFIGGLVGGVLIYVAVRNAGPPPARDGQATIHVAPAVPPSADDGALEPRQAVESADLGVLTANADRLVKAGRWREAQEAYLTVLLLDPNHQAAMRGLVRVVRTLAKGNPDTLRQQIRRYRQAITSGGETAEHYTAPAMELLIQASLRALGETAPSTRRASPTSSERPTSRPSAPRVSVRRPPSTLQPKASQPSGSPSPPSAAPQPSLPLNPDEPFLTVTIGPIASGERASLIAAELTLAGFSARTLRQERGSYTILMGPYRVSEANRAADYVRSRFGREAPVVLTPVPDVRTR